MWAAEAEGHTSCGADSIGSWSVVNGQIEPKSPSSNETFGKMLNVKIVSAQYKLGVAELLWCMLRIVWVINMRCTQNPQSQSLHTGPSGQNKTTEPFCYTLLSGCRYSAGWRHTALDKQRCEWLVQQNDASCWDKLDSVAVASGHHHCGKAKERNIACQNHN